MSTCKTNNIAPEVSEKLVALGWKAHYRKDLSVETLEIYSARHKICLGLASRSHWDQEAGYAYRLRVAYNEMGFYWKMIQDDLNVVQIASIAKDVMSTRVKARKTIVTRCQSVLEKFNYSLDSYKYDPIQCGNEEYGIRIMGQLTDKRATPDSQQGYLNNSQIIIHFTTPLVTPGVLIPGYTKRALEDALAAEMLKAHSEVSLYPANMPETDREEWLKFLRSK